MRAAYNVILLIELKVGNERKRSGYRAEGMKVNLSAVNKKLFPQISMDEAAGVPELTSRENLEGKKKCIPQSDKVNYFVAEFCEPHQLVKVKS
ncbi:hypothetical protein CDAR_215231 [Caerostris darwini]|uniref:Uncharacterized protein n=1 Tax=Caerostris darwini TaxID=1538125 RepID=A0AAV4RX73_9ARAC|nr:hypothetical protein CDAR_215231 [Caerostris darwini]